MRGLSSAFCHEGPAKLSRHVCLPRRGAQYLSAATIGRDWLDWEAWNGRMHYLCMAWGYSYNSSVKFRRAFRRAAPAGNTSLARIKSGLSDWTGLRHTTVSPHSRLRPSRTALARRLAGPVPAAGCHLAPSGTDLGYSQEEACNASVRLASDSSLH